MDLSFFADALSSGDAVVIGVAAVAVLVVLGLKVAGKSVPFVDSMLPTLVRALAALRKKPEPEAPANPDAPVVRIEDMRTIAGSFGKVTPETVAKFEADMVAAGYVKTATGEWKRPAPAPSPGGDK